MLATIIGADKEQYSREKKFIFLVVYYGRYLLLLGSKTYTSLHIDT